MGRSNIIHSPYHTCVIFGLCIIMRYVNGEIDHRTPSQSIHESIDTLESTMNKDCSRSYSATCLKLDVVSFFDKLAEQKDLGILPGVSVVKENVTNEIPASEIVANLARDFPNDIDKRIDAYLLHKVGSYLSSHSISIKLFDPKTFEASRNFNDETSMPFSFLGGSNSETGRKKEKGGNGGTLMAGLMMMKGTLGALGFGALAMLAGKALMTGLMALMLSAIVGLKSLTGGSEKKTTYEIVSKPVYSQAHTYSTEEMHHPASGHSSYGRSMELVDANVQESIQKYGNVRDRRSI